MQFRDLKAQYQALKSEIDQAVSQVITDSNFISGKQVTELEKSLAEYVGVKHCIACANGTDALTLALMAWGVNEGDAYRISHFFLRARWFPLRERFRFLWMWIKKLLI